MTSENTNRKEFGNRGDPRIIVDYEELMNNNRLNRINSTDPNNIIKQLRSPRFLGSYHLKQEVGSKFKQVDNLLQGNLRLKQDKSLKGTIFNPLTVGLMILAFAFNLFWLLQVFF
ncbi:MAG: hypothetical protein KGD66_01520 [Candidatus Lokiarchaeota archaeon]|nr:hypothetical protein [Candidatus Lokiarchaeota archaeon]